MVNIASQPLFYLALGFAGMFLCARLFDRAYKRYMPDIEDMPEPTGPSPLRPLLYTIATLCLAIVLWFALYKTSLLIADLLLLTALASFAVGSYKIRLRPLLARRLTPPHFVALMLALGLWAVPILWFMHMHLAGSYGAG